MFPTGVDVEKMAIYSPIICPTWPTETLRGSASVAAPVLLKFAMSQLRSGGILAKENVTATQSSPYRALNDCGGKAPAWKHSIRGPKHEEDD